MVSEPTTARQTWRVTAGRVLARFERWCRSRWALLAFACLGTLVVLPAARNGLQLEDRFQHSAVWSTHKYSSLGGDVFQVYYAKDSGLLPWVASDDLKISFFRPLSSLSLSFDYQIWPDNRIGPYVQSFLWLGILVAGAVGLFRRINGTWGAGALASILFALDAVHGAAVGWLAARHALMAAAFGVVAVLLFDLWRRDRSKLAGWACPLVLMLGLLSSEFAVSAIGYFVAYTIILDRSPAKRRLLASLAYFVPLGVWAVMYVRGGYGARGSGMYVSPVDEPLAAARAVLQRMPWLLTSTLGIGPAELGSLVPASRFPTWTAIGWLIAASVLALLLPLLRRNVRARFWALGMLLSSVPLCTTPPANRLLLLLPMSGMALVDILVSDLVAKHGRAPWRLAAGMLAAGWLVVHGVLSPMQLAFATRAMRAPDQWLQAAVTSACKNVQAGQQLAILQAPNYYTGSMIATLMAGRRCGASQVRVLYAGLETPVVRRVDASTLLVHVESGFFHGPLDRVYRSESRPFSVGQGLQLSGLQIVVVGVTETGSPKDVEFRYAWPLEDQRLRFVQWTGNGYAPLVLPPPGEKVQVRGLAPPAATSAR